MVIPYGQNKKQKLPCLRCQVEDIHLARLLDRLFPALEEIDVNQVSWPHLGVPEVASTLLVSSRYFKLPGSNTVYPDWKATYIDDWGSC